jgi:tetratricopeptide (TPR) repeat protein
MAAQWWDASWLAPFGGQDGGEARAAHAAALAILEDHTATGRPFGLFLHAFAIRQYYCHRPDGSGALLLDQHLDRVLRAEGARLVKVQDTDRFSATLSDAPALLLKNETWLAAVRALMARAEMIVSECQFLSPGVLAELQALAEMRRIDRTILVLPSPPLDFIGNKDDVQVFARAIHQHELIVEYPARTFVFADLIDRIGRIARLDAAERVRLIAETGLDAAVPVSFQGVPEGLERLARDYAKDKNLGAAYFAGSRAIKCSGLALGPENALQLKLRIADAYGEAGNIPLAITEFDEIEKEAATVAPAARDAIVAATRQSRSKWLAILFEQLHLKGQVRELWQLARSQTSFAIARHDAPAIAQCLSWMAVAALMAENYENARELAQDAIMYAISAKDRFREGFASVYLGHAQRRLGQDEDALRSYLTAIERLPTDRIGRIHAVAMLSAAEMAEALGRSPEAKGLFESARTMAQGMQFADLLTAAESGLGRLAAAAPAATKRSR